MTRLPMLIAALALTLSAQAQVYKWVDKDGKVIYSDKPPPTDKGKELKVPQAPAAADSQAKSAVERDKALEKSRTEARDKAKAADEAAKRARTSGEGCERARETLRGLEQGGRFARTNEKGERVILDDEQLAAEKARAEKSVSDLCKPSDKN